MTKKRLRLVYLALLFSLIFPVIVLGIADDFSINVINGLIMIFILAMIATAFVLLGYVVMSLTAKMMLIMVFPIEASLLTVVRRLLAFFSQQKQISAGYTLTGRPLNHYQAASFSAPIFAAVSFNRQEGYDKLFLSQQYIFTRRIPRNNYYEAALTTLTALTADHL